MFACLRSFSKKCPNAYAFFKSSAGTFAKSRGNFFFGSWNKFSKASENHFNKSAFPRIYVKRQENIQLMTPNQDRRVF